MSKTKQFARPDEPLSVIRASGWPSLSSFTAHPLGGTKRAPMYSQLVPAARVDCADDPTGLHASDPRISTSAHLRRAFTDRIVGKRGCDSVSFP